MDAKTLSNTLAEVHILALVEAEAWIDTLAEVKAVALVDASAYIPKKVGYKTQSEQYPMTRPTHLAGSG